MRYSKLGRMATKWMSRGKHDEIATVDLLNKYNFMTLGVCGALSLLGFWLQFKNTKIRGETFGRNYALLEDKYGEEHRQLFGTHVNKYGYPDMGNNLYSDLLPYKDWVKINNGQRCHENMVSFNPVFFTSAFISTLTFPKFTFGMSFVYFICRFFYTRSYLSFRGYNKATALEEIMKLELVMLVGSAMLSSIAICGFHNHAAVRRFIPKRFKK